LVVALHARDDDVCAVAERDPNIATSHWEAKTFLAESVFDPSTLFALVVYAAIGGVLLTLLGRRG